MPISETSPSVPMDKAERPFVMTLDVGTSSVRALMFDARGRQLDGAICQVSHLPDTTADGGAQFDADLLYERCLSVLHELQAIVGVTPDAVAASIFWHSLVGIDAKGKATTPVYLWADTRSKNHVATYRNLIDEQAVHRRTGCLAHTSYLPVRLLWLQHDRPDEYARVARWLSFPEYVWLKLFGTPAASHSIASGSGLFSLNDMAWDESVLQALELEPDQLGIIDSCHRPFTGMERGAAARLGSLARIPWFLPLGDGACSNVGSGCVTPEKTAIMIGTSGAMRTVWPIAAIRPPWGLWAYRLDEHRFVIGGALSNGGNLAHWFKERLALGDLGRYDTALQQAPPAGHGLTVLPFWAGERSPGWAAHATGAIFGLRQHTSNLDMLQAGMEAVGYRFSLIFEKLVQLVPRVDYLVATGGGLLRSPAWCQMIADILGRPLVASLEPEASSRGAALMALQSLGVWDNISLVPSASGTVFEPRPTHHRIHTEARARHIDLYERLIRD